MATHSDQQAPIAVIGGTGLYNIEGLENLSEVSVDTPYGKPSAPLTRGILGDTPVLFLARHGKNHQFNPSEVNYRANIFALKSLGVQWCIGVSAVGSLQEEIVPGDLVIPDQIIDRTRQRKSTFFEDGVVAHVPMADPYCPVLRFILLEAAHNEARRNGMNVHDGGAYLCMEGPAFSTRAESRMYRSFGARIIGMTNIPEAKLAREAEIAYATIALATDYDCWREDGTDVDAAAIIERLQTMGQHAKNIIRECVPRLVKTEPSEMASAALKLALLTPISGILPKAKERLEPLLRKYL